MKVAFIGTHGVGKTALAYRLAGRLKARDVSLEVVVEVARRCPLPLNEVTTLAAQSWILHTQVADELVAQSRYPVVLCDRSVIDNYVYLLVSHGPQPPLEPLVQTWVRTYDLLVHVPILCDASLQSDGIRSADPAFQALVEERLRHELTERGISVLELDSRSREGWVECAEAAVLEILRPPQLELL